MATDGQSGAGGEVGESLIAVVGGGTVLGVGAGFEAGDEVVDGLLHPFDVGGLFPCR